MSDETFARIAGLQEDQGAGAALDSLVETLRERKEYHQLLDALLLRKKHELNLPLVRPTSLEDVPEAERDVFEQHYVDFAREVGQLLLDDGQIGAAWFYFKMIREPEPVRKVLSGIPVEQESDEQNEELINVALYEGAHPVKGLEMMLHSHGTCNTITVMDQTLNQMDEEDRREAAALLVRQLYGDLCQSLQHDVSQRLSFVPPAESLRELMAGERDWLFDEGNYHVDVSHLNAVVRFARALNADDPELQQALELAEYGSRLDEQFQYGGDAPFDDFYPAHIQFFQALLDDGGRDEAVSYFAQQLENKPEKEDQQMIAYVLVDLLCRIDRMDEAIEPAAEHLAGLDESSGFSFSDLCHKAGRLDALQQSALKRGDLVAYTAAMLETAAAD